MSPSDPIKYYFPGEFSPPNRYDLNIVQWLSRRIYEVKEVVIVIGKSKEGEIPLNQKVDVWESYLSKLDIPGVSLSVDEHNSPLASIYKNHEPRTDEAFGIALPEKVAKNQDFQNHFSVFPRYEVIITPSYDKSVSAKMLEAISSDNFKEFVQYLPTHMTLTDKHNLFRSLAANQKSVVEDRTSEVFTEIYWNKLVEEQYKNFGIR